MGFHKVQQRGRFANTNGNISLFLVSLFTGLAPNYKIYSGRYLSVHFFYILAFYGVLFFMNHMTMDQISKVGVKVRAGNHNETHYACMVLGAGIGMLLKRRIRSKLF